MSSQNMESINTPEQQEKLAKKVSSDGRRIGKQKGSNLKQTTLKLINDKQSRQSRRNLPVRKNDKEQQQWNEAQKPRHKTHHSKQETPLQCYVKMIDYLKKIEWDQANQQNKMNPFHAMTPTCFWFSICAQYFSYNFFGKRRGNDAVHDYLNKVIKMPVGICSRISKVIKNEGLLQFQTEEFRDFAKPISEKLNHLIPAQLNDIKNDTYDKGSGVTSIAEDDLFRSSTRAWVYNYVKGRIDSSQKWKSAVSNLAKSPHQLAPRVIKRKIIHFPSQKKEEQQQQDNHQQLKQVKKRTRGRKPKNWKKQVQEKKEDVKDKQQSQDQNKIAQIKSFQAHSQQQLQNEGNQQNSLVNQQENQNNQVEQEIIQQQFNNENYCQQKNQKQEEDDDQQEQQQPSFHEKKGKKMSQNLKGVMRDESDIDVENQDDEKQIIYDEKQNQGQNEKIIDEAQQQNIQENMIKKSSSQIEQKMKSEQNDKKINNNGDPVNSHSKSRRFRSCKNRSKLNQKSQEGSNSQKQRQNRFIIQQRHYSEQDLIMQSILHLPLQKVISILHSLLPKRTYPEVVQPFMKHPTVDPLDYVFQLHPDQEDYLDYMKINRSKLLERKRKRLQIEKQKKLQEERIKRERQNQERLEQQMRQRFEKMQVQQQNTIKQEQNYLCENNREQLINISQKQQKSELSRKQNEYKINKMDIESSQQRHDSQELEQKMSNHKEGQQQMKNNDQNEEQPRLNTQKSLNQPSKKLSQKQLPIVDHYASKEHHLTVHSSAKNRNKNQYYSYQSQNQISALEDQQHDPKENQDAKCQICTDGDYTDDNLIVFCSTCNISLHQRCVGLSKVPVESWVCQLCQAFGPGGCNVPCPLCNVKGGALKRTNIHIDSGLFKENNPQYHQYTKKCNFNKQKEQYIPDQGELKQDQIYYDYFKRSTYNLTLKPECRYVWVHYVCAIWVPQCYFQQKSGHINIKGVQTIQKKRFKLQCYICRRQKAGACVKCQEPDCQKYYHPQCARKKKVYMQQLNLQKLKYLIFCADHQPLKITRQIQYKKKKQRDQIIKFCRMIEKYVQTYKIAHLPFKLHKNILTSSSLNNRLKQQAILSSNSKANVLANGYANKIEMEMKGNKNDDEEFIRNVIYQLQKNMMFVVHLEKVPSSNPVANGNLNYASSARKNFKVTLIEQPSARAMRKCLSRYNQFWNAITGDQRGQKAFSRYDQIMSKSAKLRAQIQKFLSGNGTTIKEQVKPVVQKKSNAGRKRKQKVQTQIQQDGGIFCICKKPYAGETDMFECQICAEWYHFSCIGFIGGEAQAQKLQFHCMKCLKNEDQQQARQIIQNNRSYFAPDSKYLNYRPQTPQLQSQEQILNNIQQQKNHIDMQQPKFQIQKSSSKDQKNLLYCLLNNFQGEIEANNINNTNQNKMK